MTFRGAGALAANDHAGDAQRRAVAEAFEVVRGDELGVGLGLSPEPHGMRTEAGTLQSEVGLQSLGGLHHVEDLFVAVFLLSEEIVEGKLLALPERVAAVFDFGEFVERADGGENATFFFVGRDSMKEVVK